MAAEMDRIHRVLDGELPREALSSAEEASLSEAERVLGLATAVVREVPHPDLVARVLAALPETSHSAGSAGRRSGMPTVPLGTRRGAGRQGAAASSPLRNVWGWLWNPVSLAVRPAYAGLAAAALLVAVLLPRYDRVDTAGVATAPVASAPAVQVASTEAQPRLYVQFRIEVPGAADVALAGSFTGWRAEHHLTEVAPGVWSIMLPLTPGVHDYAFVVDGKRMVVDPYAPSVADPFGGSNSRLFLPAPNGSA